MATVHVTYAEAGARGRFGDIEVYTATPIVAELITTSGVNAQGAVMTRKCIARVKSIDANCYVLGGTNPTAAAATSFRIASGDVLDLALDVGHRLGFIDV